MVKDVIQFCEEHMKKSLAHLEHDFAGLRTGRATPALLDSVKVDYYGNPTPISQCATVSASEARLLVVQPWDKSILSAVEKAIQAANLGLNPIKDANVIRVPIPPMTDSRRKELVKIVGQMTEDGRIAVRSVRRDGNEKVKILEKDKQISEDNSKDAVSDIQDLTNRYIEMMNKVQKVKEESIMSE